MMKSRISLGLVAMPFALYPLLNSSTALAQSPPLVDVCTGLRANLPILQPIASGLGGLLDTLIGGINVDLVGALSGQPIGVSALDTNGNVISTPGNCGVSTDAVAIDANTGIALGGGVLSGLGGAGNLQATAGEANSIALGNGAATTAGAAGSVALGLRGSVSAAGGVALGRDTSVTAVGGVAIGAGSVASRAGMNGAIEAYSGVAVASANGAVSVGTAGGERQITNVAGGTLDTDAVNLRQLRAVNDGLTTQVNTVSTTVNVLNQTVNGLSGGMEDVAIALGGGASYNTTTNVFVGPSYTLRGTNYTNVGKALAALDGAIGGAGTNGALAGNNAGGLPNAVATGGNATAVGYGSTASHANSTAIGTGSATTRDNQVMLGTSTSTYTMAGVGSAASRAAQTGPTGVLTTDASGNIAASDIDINQMSSDISGLRTTAAEMRKEARQGIAAAMAMASAPVPSAPGKTAWATNVAAFKGEMATSFALAHTFDSSYPVTLNASVGYAPGGSAGVRMGLSGEF